MGLCGGGGVEVRCVDLQVDEFAFVVFHDCCGFGNMGGGRFVIAIAFNRGLH